VVYQNLATLTRGNTPCLKFFARRTQPLLQRVAEAWRYHLAKLWKERKIEIPDGRDPASFIRVPDDALYYAAQGCIEVGLRDSPTVGTYLGTRNCNGGLKEGQHEEKMKLAAPDCGKKRRS